MPAAPYSDPALQWLSIADFTPGIHQFSHLPYRTSYTPNAPLGSCSTAFRCHAWPGVGLVPLPTYTIAQTKTATDPSNPVCLSMGDMKPLAARGAALVDMVTSYLTQIGTPETQIKFEITRFVDTGPGSVLNTVYSNSTATWPANTTTWPVMDYGVFQDPTSHFYARTVLTTDPITTSQVSHPGGPGTWVTVRGWTTNTSNVGPDSSTGTFPLLGISGSFGSYPATFYHGNRLGILQTSVSTTSTLGIVASDQQVIYVSDILAPTNIVSAGTFFPEMGTAIDSWGSISTGEWVGIYSEHGAVLVYGDLYAPTQAIKLPGVVGTAGIVGPAALTPSGLIYPRQGDGVYQWNGDNVAQKISTQLPDFGFGRNWQGYNFSHSPLVQTSMAVLGQWVAFPNNWMFDGQTQSWWLLEDPSIINFQVNATDGASFYCSPGIAYAAAGQTATLNTYRFQRGTTQSDYYWLSSPLPVSQDALVSIQLVEIVASNPSASPATITITPTVPVGQIPLAQQNGNQPLYFTIPANTVAYRASQRLGYADYNIQLAVEATNSNSTLPAPLLHQLNVGYTTTRTAGVQ
jgi:hypothetical protein